MNDSTDRLSEADEDRRLPYERPDLVEAGKISDVTLSDGNNSGSDSAYS